MILFYPSLPAFIPLYLCALFAENRGYTWLKNRVQKVGKRLILPKFLQSSSKTLFGQVVLFKGYSKGYGGIQRAAAHRRSV